jgi:protein-L-isoaspartate(D-aspartate) O-methyltransferase
MCAAQTARQWAAARHLMVESEVATAGIKNPAVLAALGEVPRHEFVPPELRPYAYFDMTLPIGHKQTISPPYIVAWMTQQLDPRPTDRVLEIGTGSGYQAAVLSRLAGDVYSIEINRPLAEQARRVIEQLGYPNVHLKVGDGYAGWLEHAPFDKIIVTCSPERVPPRLVEQLRDGGRMVIPLGQRFQQTLCVLAKRAGKLAIESREATFFVPMTGRADAVRSDASAEPLTPIVNGDFEQFLGPGKPAAWYYLRQATIVDGGPSAESPHYLSLTNRVPGCNAQAIQSVGLDGRRAHELVVELWAKTKNVQPADAPDQQTGAGLVISYFDEQRMPIGEGLLGPWRGTFGWQRKVARLKVPPTAYEASVAVSLLGSTGSLSCDQIELRVADPRTARREH